MKTMIGTPKLRRLIIAEFKIGVSISDLADWHCLKLWQVEQIIRDWILEQEAK